MNFSTDPEEFIEQVSQGNLTTDQVLGILEEHNHHSSECEICEYLYDSEFEFLSEHLFDKNPDSVNEETIDAAISHLTTHFAFNNGGAEEITCVKFSTNPNSSVETLKSGAMYMYWSEGIQYREEGESYPEEDFLDSLKLVAAHPKATESIFRQWLSSGHDAREEREHPDHLGSVDACEMCQSHLREAWGS